MAKKNKKKTRSGRGVEGRPGRRYELTDDGYERIEPLLPTQRRGGKWADHRTVLNGIFWVLNAGAQWRDMPERYGKWETIYGRYRRWTREGLFDKILQRLHVSLDEYGRIDWSVFDVDGSNVRAHRAAAGASKKTGSTSHPTTPWDDPAEALARSFIL
jgi:transposase